MATTKKKRTAKKEMAGLTDKQRMFVAEYLKDLNGTQAAIRSGYSKKTSNEQAARLLANVSVAAAIQKAMDERAKETKIEANAVLQEIAKLAFVNARDLFDDQGRLLPIHMMPEHVAAAVASIEVVTSRVPGGEPTDVECTAKIKFWDKRGSLELLGKHLKLFTDKLEVNARTRVVVRDLTGAQNMAAEDGD